MHRLRDLPPTFDYLLTGLSRRVVPLPGIVERLNLGGRSHAILFPDSYVIILVALKRRIEVDKVHALIFEMFAQDNEVITEEELVHERGS